MRLTLLCLALVGAFACGGSTDVQPARYNFAVVDGLNQSSTAGTASLAKPITSMLTRDPEGKFATRVIDLLLPIKAFAQTLTLSGTPVAGTIVCGRESADGEPKVVPLCAYTLADGKAVNSVTPGTRAGKFNLLFTAQAPSTVPIQDSTAVTVGAGPAVRAGGGQCSTGQPGCYLVSVGDVIDLHITMTQAWDQYNNAIDLTAITPSYAIRGPCGDGQPNCFPPPAGLIPDGMGWLVTIDPKWAGTKVFLYVFIGANVVNTWPLEVK